MLRYLRENTGNWIIKIFLGIIVVVFVFLGVGSMNSDRNNSVASIDDDPITVNEFQDAYKNMVAQMQERFQDNLTDDLLKALNVKQQALNSLIEKKLVTAQAEKLEIMVTDQELEESILAIDAFHKNGRFDMDHYKQVLGLNSLNPEMFEQIQRNALKRQKVQDMILSSISVSDLEAQNFYQYQNSRMAVEYIKVSPDEFTDLVPTEEQIQAHYMENRDRYQSDPKRRAAFLKFSPEDYQGQVTITQTQIKDYYEQHPDEFKTPEKVEASHILIKVDDTADDQTVKDSQKQAYAVYQRAVAGEDFAELAKKTSQGPSRADGGYLGIFDKTSMIQPFADKAFSMKPGEISEPVRTRFGWHVIKVMDRFDADVTSLEQAAEEIETRLAEQEMQNLAYYKAGDAFDAVIDGDTLEQAALITGRQIDTTDAFDRNGNGLELEQAAEFARAAFDLEQQQISDVKQLGNAYFLIKVLETIAPSQLPVEAVKDRITDTLTRKLRMAAAQTRAKELLEEAKASDTLEKLAQKKNLTLSFTELFTRNDFVQEIGRSADFNRAAFTLTKIDPLYPEVLKTDKGFYIISFKEKQVPVTDEIRENLSDIRQQLLEAKQRQYYQAWINELRNKSQIEIDPQFVN
ncbi:MAG: SurA N-terminal domain-containing protein [Desulfotignum sp.]|nr:SurA N-terminal domain-containing protein [Desulfotignum sp.]